MKKFLIFLIILVIIIVAGIFYWHTKANQPKVLPTLTIALGSIVEKAQAIGYIKPLHSSTVKSPVNGSVAKIFHYEGEYVHKGDPLLEVKPEPEPSDYASTYEALQEAIAVEKTAHESLLRYQQALRVGLITTNFTDYLDAQRDYETSKQQRILAAQKLALLTKGSTKVGDKTLANIVVSPIDGYILNRNVDIGDPVISLSSAQAATSLYIMANMNDLMFEGSVDEMDVAKIRLKMPAIVTVGASSTQTIGGEISKIDLQSEQESATQTDANLPFNVSFKIEVTNLKIPPTMLLRSGYSATADIKLNSVDKAIVIPERILHFKADNSIYVLLPSTQKDEKPIEKKIIIGLTDGVMAEVKSGLKVGDKVLDMAPENQDM